MNLKNNEFLMLVVAFLLGYFANRILKGCRTVEGIDNEDKEEQLSDWAGNSEFKCNNLEKIAGGKMVAPAGINGIKDKIGNAFPDFTKYYNFVDECINSGGCGLSEIPETSGKDGVPLRLYCNNDDDEKDDKKKGDFNFDM